jgi:hypothetical protein
MEDYNSNLLNDSKNEWSIRLLNILSGHIIDGFRSIFSEAIEVCEQNEEPEKYLMTYQNFLSRIPKWNQNMIETEAKRIIENSKCEYLEDLITCVHIVQLKILSCVRTSNHNSRIEIDIPNFTTFLHNVYINVARKLYSNIYLFQIDITSLEQQKNTREFEYIVQSCIMNTIRDNIPIDHLLRQYIDETQEVDIEKKAKVVKVEEAAAPTNEESKVPEAEEPNNISFSNTVNSYDPVNEESKTLPLAPPSESTDNAASTIKPIVDLNDDIDDSVLNLGESIPLDGFEDLNEKEKTIVYEDELKIGDDVIDTNVLDFEDISEPSIKSNPDPMDIPLDLGVQELSL